MAWAFLILAGFLEVVWAVAMKESDGFTRAAPTLLMAGAMLGSFVLLALAMRSLPLGTAYIVWTGVGAVGAFAAGVLLLGEAMSVTRIVAALLIIAGMTTMKLS